jgi:hypothetical protein
MTPIKKVGITIYVPAGDICEGSTFSCPLLLDMGNTSACYCVLIPDSFWWNFQRKTKHPSCPSLYHSKGNKLSVKDIQNHKLRLVEKSLKIGNFEQMINNTQDNFEDGNNV